MNINLFILINKNSIFIIFTKNTKKAATKEETKRREKSSLAKSINITP